MTGVELMGVVGFILMLMGVVWGAWRYVEGRIERATTEASTRVSAVEAVASMTRDDLADHKLHVAERYVSKEGHREATEQIMAAIGSIRSDIGAVRDRLDRMFDTRNGGQQ